MAAVSPIPAMVKHVQDYFTATSNTATVLFGRKELARQDNQGEGGANRVVFSPDPEGKAGKMSDGRLAGTQGSQRPLVTWERFLVISIWAVGEDPEDELQSYAAFEDLFEATTQALRLFTKADMTLGDPGWVAPNVERAFGLAALVPLTIRGPLLSAAIKQVTPQPRIVKVPLAT